MIIITIIIFCPR